MANERERLRLMIERNFVKITFPLKKPVVSFQKLIFVILSSI